MEKILVVLTDGFPQDTLKPTAPGIARLEKLETILKKWNDYSEVAIIGGWPDQNGETFAKKYKKYLSPDMQSKITIIDDSTNNTVDDLKGLRRQLFEKYPYRECELSIITSLGHFQRIRRTIEALGFDRWRHINSGEIESESVPRIVEIILEFINRKDPLWETWLGAIPRWYQNRRAKAYRNAHK